MFQITAEAYETSIGFLKSATGTKVRHNFLHIFVMWLVLVLWSVYIIYTIIIGQVFQSTTKDWYWFSAHWQWYFFQLLFHLLL